MAPFDPLSLKQLPANLHVTQREFGNAIGVPQSTVQRWESGLFYPSAEHLGKIYDLGVSNNCNPDFFFHENP